MYLRAPVFKLCLLQVPGGCVPRGLDPGADGGGGEGRHPRDVAAHPRHQRPGVGGAHNTQGQQRSVGLIGASTMYIYCLYCSNIKKNIKKKVEKSHPQKRLNSRVGSKWHIF